jgi:Transposase, Mutator family
VPTQRCTVHKHRNLLAHAPPRLHEEVPADYTDMIYATSPSKIANRRRAFIRKWRRLRCKAVADSLEEAGERLYTFTRLPPSQWKSARTTNAIERLHEQFKRQIKTQTVLPFAETAAMLFWALLAYNWEYNSLITCTRPVRSPVVDLDFVALAFGEKGLSRPDQPGKHTPGDNRHGNYSDDPDVAGLWLPSFAECRAARFKVSHTHDSPQRSLSASCRCFMRIMAYVEHCHFILRANCRLI